MNRSRTLLWFLLLLPHSVLGQEVISARAGMMHHVEGRVLLEEKTYQHDPARFVHLESGDRLRTEAGRAEVLFALGSFLRLGANSEMEMISAGLTSATVRLLAGSVIVDVTDMFDADSLMVIVDDVPVRLLRRGLYRFDLTAKSPFLLRVFSGKAIAVVEGFESSVKKGHSIMLSPQGNALSVRRFDRRQTDALKEWNLGRAAVVSKSPGFVDVEQVRTQRVLIENLPDRRRAGLPNP